MINLSGAHDTDFSHTDPFISVRSNESLTKVAQLLSTYHRIGVVNEKGDFIGTMSSELVLLPAAAFEDADGL